MSGINNVSMDQKASLIWNNADILRGYYKEHEYGEVILPLTVIKRLHDTLLPTRESVINTFNDNSIPKAFLDTKLKKASGFDFYNTSSWTFSSLLSSKNLEENFNEYLDGFSENIQDIIDRFKFREKIKELADPDINMLFPIIQEFNKDSADFSADKVSTDEMGYVFEQLTKKFSEAIGDGAGEHFTSRDVVELMTDLLLAGAEDVINGEGETITVYDQTMGTSQMLTVMEDRLVNLNNTLNVELYGQELNPMTFAIAKSEALIRGKNPENMKFGDTLSNDQFEGYEFDFCISNPPFGEPWKKEQSVVEKEHREKGYEGRFGPGTPKISDGQQLFLLNGFSKLNENGRMAIIQNASSLYSGDPGSGPSKIREYFIKNDFVEAIIGLPTDLFYNTGIQTFIWIISNNKSENRKGKIQLIDASRMFTKRKKNLGDKKVDILGEEKDLIVQAYGDFAEKSYSLTSEKFIESKILDNDCFAYTRIILESVKKDSQGNTVFKLNKKGEKTNIPEIEKEAENIPFGEDIEEYIIREVYPFNPNAKWNKKLDKIGYEIPFTRLFFRYVKPEASEIIAERIKVLEESIILSFEKLTNKDVKVDE
ncbi:type I restriction-modification system subunit M [Lysinibacillus parviboronicapiens]|uniref:type I restriction-modification system subunit M n=1 Tax=Lysinibacillus parviboronicapiens TaxID=436516 RepID=UPI000D3A1C81|nr:class I SAM-dependent DNA methyltransferase [Lysinibacillus parviboronicapiens]